MYPCPYCGRPWVVCGGRCRGRNEELENYIKEDDNKKFDVSFQCYTCECHFDKQPTHEHEHNNRSLLLSNNWEDVAALWCKNLISIGKYKSACENKNNDIIKNDTIHDYILTRLENIEGCYSILFLNGKMDKKHFQFFEKIQNEIVEVLNDDEVNTFYWTSVKLFNNYLTKTLESDFFKENNIRIENRSF